MAINTNSQLFGRVVSTEKKNTVGSKSKKVFGMGFPIGKGSSRGYVGNEVGLELVKNNLRQLLQTEKGERVMLPNYGVKLKKYLFEALDQETFGSIKQEILTSIARYIKGVKVLKLRVLPIDDFGLEGLQAIRIDLLVQIKELEGAIVEVGVKIN